MLLLTRWKGPFSGVRDQISGVTVKFPFSESDLQAEILHHFCHTRNQKHSKVKSKGKVGEREQRDGSLAYRKGSKRPSVGFMGSGGRDVKDVRWVMYAHLLPPCM